MPVDDSGTEIALLVAEEVVVGRYFFSWDRLEDRLSFRTALEVGEELVMHHPGSMSFARMISLYQAVTVVPGVVWRKVVAMKPHFVVVVI